MLPTNSQTTCNLGRGTLIDYGICSDGLAQTVKLEALAEVPWKTHSGLVLSLRHGKEHWWYRALRTPKQLPICPRPVRAADPNSKR